MSNPISDARIRPGDSFALSAYVATAAPCASTSGPTSRPAWPRGNR